MTSIKSFDPINYYSSDQAELQNLHDSDDDPTYIGLNDLGPFHSEDVNEPEEEGT